MNCTRCGSPADNTVSINTTPRDSEYRTNGVGYSCTACMPYFAALSEATAATMDFLYCLDKGTIDPQANRFVMELVAR